MRKKPVMKLLLALAALGLLACAGPSPDSAAAPASPTPPAAAAAAPPTPPQGPGAKDYQEGRELFEQGCQPDGFDEKQCRQAVSKLERAVKAEPGLKEASLALARAYWNQTQGTESKSEQAALEKKAKDVLERLVALDPNYADAYFELGVRADDPAEQQRLLERTVAADPRHPQAHRLLAQSLLDRGRVEDAVREYKLHLQVSPERGTEDAARHVDFALALEGLGRTKEAADILHQTLKLTEGQGELERCRLFEHVDLKRYATFAQFRAGVERLRPYCTNVGHRDRAVRLQSEGKTDEAVAELQEQLRQNPSYREAYFLLEQIYLKRGDRAKALTVIKKFFDTEKDPAERCRAVPLVHLTTYQGIDPLFVGRLRQECELRK